MLFILFYLIFSIFYEYDIETLSLKIRHTDLGEEITQKDVRSHAPINELLATLIEDGIESIGENSFIDYSKMNIVSLGYGIKTIKAGAFERCRALKSIIFPDSLQSLGERVLYDCSSLENITIPASLTNMASNSIFNGASSISHFFISKGNNIFSTSSDNTVLIKDNTTAFSGPGAYEIIKIPDNVKRISENFVYGRSKVIGINFSTLGNIEYIGSVSFCFCSISNIEFPEGLLTIGDEVFQGNRVKIQKMVIPKSVKQVGNIFSGVEEIIIKDGCAGCQKDPDGTIYNGDRTGILLFPNTLTDYILPSSIKSINPSHLRNSPDLTNLTVDANNQVYSDYKNLLYNKLVTKKEDTFLWGKRLIQWMNYHDATVIASKNEKGSLIAKCDYL